MLLRDQAAFPLAERFRREGAPIGEVFSFVSGLYFRGKMAYASAFAMGSARVIAAGRGLLPPETIITLDEFRAMAAVPVDPAEPLYLEPFERDARALEASEIVLLGSIATPKYIGPLAAIFGERLLVPSRFVGLGDMSRGSLMLRAAAAGEELAYIPALHAKKKK